ncbi:MAG: hypothetical protein HY848_09335 [Betaproteobacteria bacterium]|nr:hypothetical protein [Betaproteobacteria bacterium]
MNLDWVPECAFGSYVDSRLPVYSKWPEFRTALLVKIIRRNSSERGSSPGVRGQDTVHAVLHPKNRSWWRGEDESCANLNDLRLLVHSPKKYCSAVVIIARKAAPDMAFRVPGHLSTAVSRFIHFLSPVTHFARQPRVERRNWRRLERAELKLRFASVITVIRR